MVIKNRDGLLGVYVLDDSGREILIPGVMSICIDPVYADTDVTVPTARISLMVDIDLEVKTPTELPVTVPVESNPLIGVWFENTGQVPSNQPAGTYVEVILDWQRDGDGINTRPTVRDYCWEGNSGPNRSRSNIARYRFYRP